VFDVAKQALMAQPLLAWEVPTRTPPSVAASKGRSGGVSGLREHLEQIQMLSPVDRVSVDRRSALKGGLPRRDRYEDRRHRKNHRKPKSETIWCPRHLPLL